LVHILEIEVIRSALPHVDGNRRTKAEIVRVGGEHRTRIPVLCEGRRPRLRAQDTGATRPAPGIHKGVPGSLPLRLSPGRVGYEPRLRAARDRDLEAPGDNGKRNAPYTIHAANDPTLP